MARREPSPVAGLDGADPDRVAGKLAARSATPSVSIILFNDYITREILLEAIRAELKHVWGMETACVEVRSLEALEAFLDAPPCPMSFLTGMEDALELLAPHLNVARDALAERRAVLWLPADRYRILAESAPDLVSYAVIALDEPALVGGVVPASALEPSIVELELKFGMTTEEFTRQARTGSSATVPDAEAHRWATLARVLGRL